MKVAKNFELLSHTVQQWKREGLTVGFVPTMGNLHAGHIKLLKQAQLKCDRVVVSIFVNPLQFNDASDFNAYPKTLPQDEQVLQAAGADLLFLPNNELIYPEGQQLISKVHVPLIGDELEGACRPGHFDGVATVVNKLFNLVQPQLALFGEKDFQQLLLVKKMVKDLNMPLEICSVATQREADGLAMSSRNTRLTAEQRKIAAQLYQVLLQLSQQLEQPDADISQLEAGAMQKLREQGFEPEYVSVRWRENLQPVLSGVTSDSAAADSSVASFQIPSFHGLSFQGQGDRERNNRQQKNQRQNSWIILAAVSLGDVRLIDNI